MILTKKNDKLGEKLPNRGKGKGKVHPRAGHEGLNGD